MLKLMDNSVWPVVSLTSISENRKWKRDTSIEGKLYSTTFFLHVLGQQRSFATRLMMMMMVRDALIISLNSKFTTAFAFTHKLHYVRTYISDGSLWLLPSECPSAGHSVIVYCLSAGYTWTMKMRILVTLWRHLGMPTQFNRSHRRGWNFK